ASTSAQPGVPVCSVLMPGDTLARYRSNLYHHRKDHRPAARPVVNQLAYRVVEVLLQELDLDDVLCEQLAEDAIRLIARLVEELVRAGEAARDQLGPRHRHAVLRSERCDDNQDAVLAEPP